MIFSEFGILIVNIRLLKHSKNKLILITFELWEF
jgi:hypothetical protein